LIWGCALSMHVFIMGDDEIYIYIYTDHLPQTKINVKLNPSPMSIPINGITLGFSYNRTSSIVMNGKFTKLHFFYQPSNWTQPCHSSPKPMSWRSSVMQRLNWWKWNLSKSGPIFVPAGSCSSGRASQFSVGDSDTQKNTASPCLVGSHLGVSKNKRVRRNLSSIFSKYLPSPMACKEQFKESHPMWDQNGFQKKTTKSPNLYKWVLLFMIVNELLHQALQ
jgi:hypothetical protein